MALAIGDFERKDVAGTLGHYWTAKTDRYEVCLEACFNGYDVALYELKPGDDVFVKGDGKRLVGEKTCADIPDIPMVAAMAGELPPEALKKALEIANQKLATLESEAP